MIKVQYDPEKVIERILEVERLFPVNKWTINGISFWPFIRTSLAYTQRDLAGKARKTKERSSLTMLKGYGQAVFVLPFHILSLLLKIKSANRIFVGAETHRITMNGLKVNKYFDAAVADFNERDDRSIILDRGMSLEKSRYPNKRNWFSLPSLFVFLHVLKRIGIAKKNRYQFELDQYDSFYNHLLEKFENPDLLKFSYSEAALKRKMINFYDRKEFLKELLAKSGVKNVYFLCYYSSLFYPFIAACNELNINTIDVQHGGMGKGHFAYDRWVNVPKEGYMLLPKYFWTWDANSAKLINNWASSSLFHTAVNMGTPWQRDFVSLGHYKSQYTDYILFNMTDDVLENYMLEAIRHFGNKKKWVLRMHPRQLAKKTSLENEIQNKGIGDFVSVEDSTQVLLMDSLRFCSVFVSASSGSIIEAIQAGFKPILVPSPGFSYYTDYIKSGQVIALPEKDGRHLISIIEDTAVNSSMAKERAAATGYRNGFSVFEKNLANVGSNDQGLNHHA